MAVPSILYLWSTGMGLRPLYRCHTFCIWDAYGMWENVIQNKNLTLTHFLPFYVFSIFHCYGNVEDEAQIADLQSLKTRKWHRPSHSFLSNLNPSPSSMSQLISNVHSVPNFFYEPLDVYLVISNSFIFNLCFLLYFIKLDVLYPIVPFY